MRILFLTQVLPYPLDAGPKVRAYFTLRHLAARHRVTLVSLVRPDDDPAAVAHLKTICNGVMTVPLQRTRWGEALALGRSLANGQPFLIARDEVLALHQLIAEQVGGPHDAQYDVIHADQLWMAPYALKAREVAQRRAARPVRLVLDQHNAVYLVPRRMAEAAGNPLVRRSLLIEARRMARFEAQACLEFDRVVTVTTEDDQALHSLYSNGNRPAPFKVIPICVEPRPQGEVVGPTASEPATILFVGGMHWPPNADAALWFAREVLPNVWQQHPQAKFAAVGRRPPTALRQGDTRIEAPGYVADSEPYWGKSRAFVVPLRSGGGMRVKILDAWSRGLPVISTSIGAEGLAYCDGENILIADTPEGFADAVVRVLSESDLAARLAAGGRATVEQHYDWRKIYPAWDEVYASLGGDPQAGRV